MSISDDKPSRPPAGGIATVDAKPLASPAKADADVRDAEAFEAYLDAGGEAQDSFDDLRRMLAVVGELEPVSAPEDFYDQVARKLRRRRLFTGEAAAAGLVSLPFQVVSVLAILIVAALYLLAEIDRHERPLQRDPSVELAGPETPPSVD